MIVNETVTHTLYDTELRNLLGLKRKDKLAKIEALSYQDGTPMGLRIVVTRPQRGRYLNKVKWSRS